MRNPQRIDSFCEQLKVAWKKLPDWRFFQLVENFMSAYGDPFYVEDGDAIKKLTEYVDNITASRSEE